MLWSSLLPRGQATPTPWLLSQVKPIWNEMTSKRTHAGPILSQHLRTNRSLGSKDRRRAGDILLGLIRHEHALKLISPSEDDPLEAWLTLCEQGSPPALEHEPDNAYATALSLPPQLAQQWWNRLGPSRAITLAQTLNTRAPIFLRTLQHDATSVSTQSLLNLPVPWTPLGPHTLRLEGRCNLQATAAFKKGLIEIQDLGSQKIAEQAFVRAGGAGSRVLDMCAGV